MGCAESTTPTNNNPNNKALTSGTVLGGTVYYTGFDNNVNNYDIFINTSRAITIHDPSVATANQEFVTVDAVTVAQQVEQIAALYAQAGENFSSGRRARYERRFANPSIWKIRPLKAGITTFSAESARRTESIWEKAEIRTIVVSAYSAQQVQQGQIRYESGSPACTQCHNTSFNSAVGAPPHLLGRVMEINDNDAAQWITTGAVKDRYTNGHSWSFLNDTEKFATVAYLRSKQTTSKEDYAKLLFEEELAETKAELGLPQ